MIDGAALRMLYRAGRYRWKLDRAEIAFVRGRLRPGDTAVDVGAHKGAYAFWMHRAVTPGGCVVCFEPQPELAAYLRRMKQGLRLEGLQVENLAVSSRAGEMEISVPAGGSSPSATLEPGLVQGAATQYAVRVTTLDQYIGTDRPVRLIKCDVEGHELEVFRGAQQLLLASRPALLFECEARHHRRDTPAEVFAFLAALGYEGRFFSRTGLRPLREFDPARHGDPAHAEYANNFAFLPAGEEPPRR
jgi:FkbM family methyltransferase